MTKQETKSLTYDLRRVDKVNLMIIWAIIAIIIEQAFLKGAGRGPRVMLQALPVGVLVTAIYFIPFNRFLKSLLFGVIPAAAICMVMYLDSFSLDRHYMLLILNAVIALYFNPKLLVTYCGIVNALIIALYLAARANFLGDNNSLPYFLSVFFMLNGQIIAMFFLTKWGSGILSATSRSKAELQGLFDRLSVLLTEINSVAEQVAAGTAQVAAGSQTISQGATEQAAAVEELSASLTEIAEQTSQNAVKTNEARAIALEAQNQSARGNERMDALQSAMEEINQSSEDISRIIKVIDDIAFQTNILALNAAVEAARAGIHGKGFAVVAEEVRSLAQRSAQAARETSELIAGSMNKVHNGTRIADDTAKALNSILDGAVKSMKFMDEIAVASNEQAEGIEQISRGIDLLSRVIQTNSATAQQTAAASEQLSEQAEMLNQRATRFSSDSVNRI